jgi:hypothetical protein
MWVRSLSSGSIGNDPHVDAGEQLHQPLRQGSSEASETAGWSASAEQDVGRP